MLTVADRYPLVDASHDTAPCMSVLIMASSSSMKLCPRTSCVASMSVLDVFK